MSWKDSKLRDASVKLQKQFSETPSQQIPSNSEQMPENSKEAQSLHAELGRWLSDRSPPSIEMEFTSLASTEKPGMVTHMFIVSVLAGRDMPIQGSS